MEVHARHDLTAQRRKPQATIDDATALMKRLDIERKQRNTHAEAMYAALHPRPKPPQLPERELQSVPELPATPGLLHEGAFAMSEEGQMFHSPESDEFSDIDGDFPSLFDGFQ